MIETPRMDEAEQYDADYGEHGEHILKVAQQLEIELTAMTAERDTACDISTCCLREVSALKGRVVDLDTQLSTALESIRRRDEVMELIIKNDVTCVRVDCPPEEVDCEQCKRNWIKSKLEAK